MSAEAAATMLVVLGAVLVVRDIRPPWYVLAKGKAQRAVREKDFWGAAVGLLGALGVVQFFASRFGSDVWWLGVGLLAVFCGIGFWPLVRTLLWGVYGVEQRFGGGRQ